MAKVSLQEEFSPAMYQLVQNLTVPSGRCEYEGVSHWLGFGTREARVLFPSEAGGAAVHQRGPATHPPPPAPLGLPARWEKDRLAFSRVPSAAWSMGCPDPQGMPPPPSTPQATHPQKPPLITPLFSVLTQGNWGKALAIPSPLPLPHPLARRNPAALPRVHRAGLIRDVLMMNASSWSCGSVSRA